jgi:preprotein translocase subunit SecE
MKIKSYIQESFRELVEKVSWPTWAELQGSTVVVMVASLLIALVVFSMDFVFERVMHLIYSLLN